MRPADIQKHDERLLLKKIAARDEQAFRLLYDQYRKKVYTYALKLLKFEDRAEDIVHEVFLRIWQHDHLEEIENLEGYLHIVARNSTLQLLRKQQLELKANRELAHDWKETHEDTEQTIMWNDAHKHLQEAIEFLPPQQRAVFRLCREEGLKYEEVAERMAISRLTVKTHMQHALRSLRLFLHRHNDVIILMLIMKILFQK